MTSLTIFGLVACVCMMGAYAFEHKGHFFVLGFAASCVLGAIYAFLQGAWPFGVLEIAWTILALVRWLRTSRAEFNSQPS